MGRVPIRFLGDETMIKELVMCLDPLDTTMGTGYYGSQACLQAGRFRRCFPSWSVNYRQVRPNTDNHRSKAGRTKTLPEHRDQGR